MRWAERGGASAEPGGASAAGREQPDAGLSLAQALALGALQGPTELLPVSSSAHTTLVPWLLGWRYARLDGERRKSFELALHAGAALALALSMRSELMRDTAGLDRARAGAVGLALAIPAAAGYALERQVERRLGGARSIAAGLALGAVALWLADAPAAAQGPPARTLRELGPRDGVALGLAQTTALMPGVSRNGATLTVALARGFDRRSADALSWHAGLPVMLGASALQVTRLLGRGSSRRERTALGAGALAAFASTLASARVLDRGTRARLPLRALAGYRLALACIVAGTSAARATRTGRSRPRA